MYIGPHLSIAAGFHAAGKAALDIGANTFQFFTRNPRGGKVKALNSDDVAALETLMRENQFGPLLAHAPYTMNLCAEKPATAEFAERVFLEDLERMEALPCNLYNFHPGSHTGQGVAIGIDKIVNVINKHNRGQWSTTLLLETMAGKGTEIGRRFEELKRIIDRLDYADNVGVCMDTCHVYSAGYDIVDALDNVLETFDRIIGLERLHAIHFNDSQNPFASFKDRHAEIGKGSLGLEALLAFIEHPAIKNLPILLETPLALTGHKSEIAMIRSKLLARR